MQLREDELAHVAVEDACMSAKRRPKDWTTIPIRLAEPVKKRLETRRAQDETTTGVKFAETHYLDAALSRLPSDPEGALQWAEEYRDGLGLKAPDSTGSTGRVRKVTAESATALFLKVRTIAGYGYNSHLQNAAVVRLLDALDRRDQEVEAAGEVGVVDLDD